MRYGKQIAAVGAVALAATALVITTQTGHARATICARYYVATGDGVPFGKDAAGGGSDDSSVAYPKDLLNNDLMNNPPSGSGPWCLQNIAKDGTTTDTYVNGSSSQMAVATNYKPTLVTIQLGRQNTTIVDSITTCLTDIKNHEFTDASSCALGILARQDVFDKLRNDMSAILNKWATQMSGYPKLVVVVVGYFNPYTHTDTAIEKMADMCPNLVDTIPTCIARWTLLPPALIALDEVVKKINSTLQPVVQKFATGYQGRFVWINPYDSFNDHCMKMDVSIYTTVEHPEEDGAVHEHDSTDNAFGCDNTYIATDGNDGGIPPWGYLPPAIPGVLINTTQTTKNLGVNPNSDGHTCIAKLIWYAVYQKLGWPQTPIPPSTCS